MVLLNDDKLLKSTTEGGRLFHIKAVRSVKKLRLTSKSSLCVFAVVRRLMPMQLYRDQIRNFTS